MDWLEWTEFAGRGDVCRLANSILGLHSDHTHGGRWAYCRLVDFGDDARFNAQLAPVGKLDRAGFAVASGAACSSANPEPSHVLQAMGVAPAIARGAVRVSLGAGTSAADIEQFINAVQATVGSLHGLVAVNAA